MTLPRAFLFGLGGHGRSVLEVVRRQGAFEVVAGLDDNCEPGTRFQGIEVIGGRDAIETLRGQEITHGFVSVGNNADRELLSMLIKAAGLTLFAAVDPGSIVAREVPIGAGTVVMPGAIVNVGSSVGQGVILNTGCTVDHDCQIEDYAHLSPGVHLSGACTIGARAHIGIGACVTQQVRVGERALVGAGAAIVNDVAAGVVAAGVPARPLSSSP